VCLAFLLAAGLHLPARGQGEWKAGVAVVNVTPRDPIPLAGFASRVKGPSHGVDADLHVKALALQDRSGKTAVIVTADLIGFNKSLSAAIAERCLKQYGVTRDRLLLNASHTHSGPMLGGGTAAGRRAIDTYAARLIDQVVGVVGKAIAGLAPAEVRFGQGLAGFAVNRRRSRPNTRQFPGPVDHDVPVLAVRAPDGKLRAVLFGYACHATTMADYKVNADYPGYAQAALEKMNPGVVALFMQGCGADSNPLPRYHGEDREMIARSLELAGMYGRILAAGVDFVLRGKMTPVAGPLRSGFEYLELPFEPRPTREELELRAKSDDLERRAQAQRLVRDLDAGKTLPERNPFAMQVFRFGDGLKLIALGGEVVVDYALRLKAAHGWEDTWVAAYSNELAGYIPSRRVLLEGGYETRGGAGGAYSTAIEEMIVERLDLLLRRVR